MFTIEANEEVRICPTCFRNVRFPRTTRNQARYVTEMCVDKCHDEFVLGGSGDDVRFLRAAIKSFRKAKLSRGTGVTLPASWQSL